MTELDQAFIKAFHLEQATPPDVVSTPADVAAVTAEAGLREPAAPNGSPAPAFEPALQVDGFAWPGGCTRLGLNAGVQIDQLAEALKKASERNQRVVAIAGGRRGDGCTTLLLCAARRLAERDLRLVMVDADFDDPALARRLGLLPEYGWEKVVAGRRLLEEVAIDSVEDRLAIVPLCDAIPIRAEDDRPQPSALLDVLGKHYDLVLVDLGAVGECTPGDAGPLEAVAGAIDAVVLVHNVAAASPDDLAETRRRVKAAGLDELGVAENFVKAADAA